MSSPDLTQPPPTRQPLPLWPVAGLAAAVFAASLFGIFTRPIGFFAIFWPANALLAGLMVRHPELARLSGWGAATLGYIAADLATGSNWLTALWLTGSNLSGVAVVVVLMSRVNKNTRFMRRQGSALYVLAVCCAAASVATITGSGAGPVLFNTDIRTMAPLWFCTELMNYALVLPVLLSMPLSWKPESALATKPPAGKWNWAPLGAVLISEIAAYFVGGPGAMAFAVPALLWCALTYSVFTVSALTMVVGFLKTVEVTSSAFMFLPDHLPSVFSFRVGLTLLSFGPLAAACASVARNEMLERLHRAVNIDFLTGALARRAFMTDGERHLARLARQGHEAAVLMLDLDHFKAINDNYGHAVGDLVLTEFASAINRSLRPGDLFGRLGGEEFAVLLPGVSRQDTLSIASRLNEAVRSTAYVTDDGSALKVTVSIGVAHAAPVPQGATLDALLQFADARLYEAKAQGRNRFVADAFSAPQ